MRQIFYSVLTICALSVVAASQSPLREKIAKAIKPVEDFVIGPEDVLGINVWREPELTSKVTVRPDGKIGIPLLNDVQASGLTTQQLQERITAALNKFVSSPQVSVIVLEIHSQLVHVMGAVARPGAYPVGGPLTVIELLSRAGGLAEFSKSKDILIVRKEGATTTRFPFNYESFVEGKNFQQNIALRSGDVVIVP